MEEIQSGVEAGAVPTVLEEKVTDFPGAGQECLVTSPQSRRVQSLRHK